jgi:segregation and condensation protein A
VSDPEPFEAGQAAYTVTLPAFEGPLDLLLHLCQKHELNILDIPISFVTEKYLEYLAVMQMMQLDIAAEYLVMAATLAHIKSKMLLPAPPPGQEDDELLEEEDPRAALIKRLLEYQKYKQAGADLLARGVQGKDVFYRGSTPEALLDEAPAGQAPLADIPLFRLVEAFQGVLAKSKVRIAHDVTPDRISITDRIHELVDFMRERKRVQFDQLFEAARDPKQAVQTKFDLVITFLALLEMARLRLTRLYQTDNQSPLWVESIDDAEVPPLDEATIEGAGAVKADSPATEESAKEAP